MTTGNCDIARTMKSRCHQALKAIVVGRRTRVIVLLLALEVLAFPLCAQNTQPTATSPSIITSPNTAPNVLLAVRVGYQFGLKTGDFFTNYRYALGVRNPDFSPPFTIGGALKMDFGSWRIGIDGEYFSANIDEQQDVTIRRSPVDTTVIGSRKLTEKVSLNVIPLLATVEYVPVQAQFRTYIGLSAGIGIANMTWNEKVSSTVVNDTRVGGNLLDDAKTLPAFRIHSGVQLGYDRLRSGNKHFGSLIIEVRYTYMPYSVAAFRKIAQQFPEQVAAWNQEFTIGASALSLQIGVQFNLSRLR